MQDKTRVILERIETKYNLSHDGQALSAEERMRYALIALEGRLADRVRLANHWRITAEQILSETGLLTEAPAEPITPERFRELVQPSLRMLHTAGRDLLRMLNALGVDSSQPLGQVEQAIAEINRLKSWASFAMKTCNVLAVAFTADNPPEIGAVGAAIEALHRPNLHHTISTWAEDRGRHWSQDQVVIARGLVVELLEQIAAGHLESDSAFASLIVKTKVPKGTVPLEKEVLSPEIELRVAIENWLAENSEIREEDRINAATNFVTDLLVEFAERDPDTARIAFLTSPKTVLIDAIDCWANEIMEQSWHEDYLKHSARLVSQLLSLLHNLDVGLNDLDDLASVAAPIVLQESGVFKIERLTGQVKAEKIASSDQWVGFEKFLSDYWKKAFSYRNLPPNWTPGYIREILIALEAKEKTALDYFTRYQTDVISWMRAMAMMVEAAANGGTHAEKDARYRGVIALLETSMQRARNARDRFVQSYWWEKPDLFTSDYPVKPLLDRVHELEKQIEKLKGEPEPPTFATTIDDQPF